MNTLIQACRQGEHVFGAAAKDVVDDTLRVKLTRIAQVHADFADKLTAEAESLGVEVEKSRIESDYGFAAGSTESDRSIVDKCRRVEEVTLAKIERAVSLPELSSSFRELLERESGAIRAAVDDLPY